MSTQPPSANQKSAANAGAEKPSRLLLQLNQRLLNLSEQVSRLQSDIDGMASVVDDSGMQVSTLVDNLTETQSSAQLQKRLAELTEQMNAEHEQLNYLSLKVTETARQEQLVRLAGTVATQSQVSSVLEIVQQVARSLELANRYSETREEHIEALTTTLRGIVSQRQETAERGPYRQHDMEQLQRSAKSELLSVLLPVMDGLDVAQRQAETIVAEEREAIAAAITQDTSDDQLSGSLFGKFRSRGSAEATNGQAARQSSSDARSASPSANERLLQQISIVQERMATLLSLEGVTQLHTVGERYNSRRHIAVDTEYTANAEDGIILRELRRGYAQGERVLRYAEVVIAAAPSDESAN